MKLEKELDLDTEVNPNVNINEYLEYLKNTYPKILNNLIFNFSKNNISIQQNNVINYYNEPNYTKEFFESFHNNLLHPINYTYGSFTEKTKGLEKSQLKTLFHVLQLQNNDERYIPINGGPGVGKSTIVNYILSNLIFKFNNNKQLWTPNILITGKTKESVKNISEITTIEPPEKHKWFKNQKYQNEIEFLFYKLDIDYRQLKEFTNSGSIQVNFNKSYLLIEKTLLEFSTTEFFINFKKYFNIPIENNIDANIIIPTILHQIEENNQIILSLNNLINNRLKNSYSIELKQVLQIEELLEFWNNIDLNNVLNLLDYLLMKLTNNPFFNQLEEVEKIQNLKKKSENKFLKMFLTKANIHKTTLNLLNSIKLKVSKKFDDYLKGLKKDLKIINNTKIKTIMLELNINIDEINNLDLTTDKIENILYKIDIFLINFNLIQKYLDINIRTENTFLCRHLQEWFFLNQMFQQFSISNSKNFILYFKDLLVIKPIISANLQQFSMKTIQKKFGINYFDYVIVDEASQVNATYAIYLEAIANKIIAIGDEKQLPPICDDSKNSGIVDTLEKTIGSEYSSLLNFVNSKTKLTSNIGNNNEIYKKGLFLLEHFRCPEQIYRLINKHFYEDTLNFMNLNDEPCLISKEFKNCYACNDTSLMYLNYDFKPNYLIGVPPFQNKKHINWFEIQIGFNFLIDNFELICEHILVGRSKNANKVAKEICFINLHRLQANVIDDLIDFLNFKESKFVKIKEYYLLYIGISNRINQHFKTLEAKKFFIEVITKMKRGTIDSLQGVGCEFVIFSNIKPKYNIKLDEFENGEKRINVLLSRVKKHFIHIISNNYWDVLHLNQDNSSIAARQEIEIDAFNQGYSKIIFNVKDTNQNLSIQNNNSIQYNSSEKKISTIGKWGEKIFNSIIQDDDFKQLIINKINKHTKAKINADRLSNYQSKWLNESSEAWLPYDFILNNDLYIDVKSSIKSDSTDVYMSLKEYEFALKNYNNYLVAKINDIQKYNLNLKNKSTLAFILKNINFFMLENQDDCTEKKLISNSKLKQQTILIRS